MKNQYAISRSLAQASERIGRLVSIGTALGLLFLCSVSTAWAQTVAVYPVKTEGFTLNQSEVTEISRIALQACYDEGFTCLPRGYTLGHIQKEQALGGGGGTVQQAPYIAEMVLTGKTKKKVDVGLGGFRVFGGAAKRIGGVYVGGGTSTALKGIRIAGSGMHLTGQFFRTVDGAMVFSKTRKKLGMTGEFIIISGRSSNAVKLRKAFRKIFKEAKKHLASGA